MENEKLILQKLEKIEQRSVNALNVIDGVRRILEKMEETGAREKLQLCQAKINGKSSIEQLYLAAEDLVQSFKSLKKAHDDKSVNLGRHFELTEIEVERVQEALYEVHNQYGEFFLAPTGQ